MSNLSAQDFVRKTLAALTLCLAFTPAFAEKMDLQTHDLVISKLRHAIESLGTKDDSYLPSAIRLADLLADRSRIKMMKEVEQNCQNCLKSEEDRKESLNWYQQTVGKVNGELLSRNLLQMAFLKDSLGQFKKAEADLQTIIKNKGAHLPLYRGQAFAKLGDMYFKQGEFKKAFDAYSSALTIKQTPEKEVVVYRQAWCMLNLSRVKPAISQLERLLQTEDLDESFRMDISRDLALFYARDTVTMPRIQRLFDLSPESQRKENIVQLAKETERLGKKSESALVWMYYLNAGFDQKEGLEAKVRLARLEKDLNHVEKALGILRQATAQAKEEGCKKECDAFQTEFHKMIKDWTREEKKHLTLNLFMGYQIYGDYFKEDADMLFRSAILAQDLKRPDLATVQFQKAVISSYNNLDDKKLTPEERTAQEKILEGSLLGQIEMAEASNNPNARQAAYLQYLKIRPTGPKAFEVKFNLAHLSYELKNYPQAGEAFRRLALENDAKNPTLQKQAADLALDSMMVAKRNEEVESWSRDFAKRFPSAQAQYLTMSRRASLEIVAARINAKQTDSSDMRRLMGVSLIGSSKDERTAYFRNKYLVAFQIKDLASAKAALREWQELVDKNSSQYQEVLDKRIFIAELEMDFASAYALSQRKNFDSEEARNLKLLILADLSGKSGTRYENAILSRSRSLETRLFVIVNQVRRSSRPVKMLGIYSSELARSPETFNKLALEVYGHTKDLKVLSILEREPRMRRSTAVSVILRAESYHELRPLLANLRSARLNTRSDRALEQSLNNKLTLLGKLENFYKRPQFKADPILQAVLSRSYAYESQRLADEILTIPAPKKMKPQQIPLYQNALAQQAAPYQRKSQQAQQISDRIWSDTSWLESLKTTYRSAKSQYRKALALDLDLVISVAPASTKEELTSLMLESQKPVSNDDVQRLKWAVQKNPFDMGKVSELREVEMERGNEVMVAHLDERLKNMKRGN